MPKNPKVPKEELIILEKFLNKKLSRDQVGKEMNIMTYHVRPWLALRLLRAVESKQYEVKMN